MAGLDWESVARTPNGKFQKFRMEADHFSKEFDDAPMPHSIFFTKIGHAIHGTFSEGSLGVPVSHGCVRISRANASTLFSLVKTEGVLNTTVSLTGSSRVALARNPRGKRKTDVARRDSAPTYQSYDAAGDPVDITPGQIAPGRQPQATVPGNDGYIYLADGSSNDPRFLAPPSYRRLQGAQNVPQPQQYCYGDQAGYGYAQPQIYVPRPYRREVYSRASTMTPTNLHGRAGTCHYRDSWVGLPSDEKPYGFDDIINEDCGRKRSSVDGGGINI